MWHFLSQKFLSNAVVHCFNGGRQHCWLLFQRTDREESVYDYHIVASYIFQARSEIPQGYYLNLLMKTRLNCLWCSLTHIELIARQSELETYLSKGIDGNRLKRPRKYEEGNKELGHGSVKEANTHV